MFTKKVFLDFAEIADAWRVVPRVLVAAYSIMVFSLISWYRDMNTVEQVECDNAVLTNLLDRGMDAVAASDLACAVIDVVGGPTTEQTAFATAIIGLSTAIFAFYVNSGRRWDHIRAYRNERGSIDAAQDYRDHKNTDEY